MRVSHVWDIKFQLHETVPHLGHPFFRNQSHAEAMLQRAVQEREAARLAAFPVDPNAINRVNNEPQPDLCVRFNNFNN